MDSLKEVLMDIREWCDKERLTVTHVTVGRDAAVSMYSYKPSNNGHYWMGSNISAVLEFEICKKLLTVCNPKWQLCCYELPPSKPKHESDELIAEIQTEISNTLKEISELQKKIKEMK